MTIETSKASNIVSYLYEFSNPWHCLPQFFDICWENGTRRRKAVEIIAFSIGKSFHFLERQGGCFSPFILIRVGETDEKL